MAHEKAKDQVSDTNVEKTSQPPVEPPKTTTVQEAQNKLKRMAGKATIEVTPPVETPTVEVASEEVQENALELVQPAQIKDGQLMLTPKHLELIKTQIAKNATKAELDLFLMMAYRTRLDPLMKQLYFIKYGEGEKAKVSYVTSIDGYRIIAHRTGLFAGVDLPIYEYDKTGRVTHCAITVHKIVQNQIVGFGAKVKFSEYNTNQNNWSKMPETMIAKVAEAHALRKAFPNDLSGIYTQDEMDQMQIQQQSAQNPEKVVMISPAQEDKIKALLVERDVDVEKIKQYAKNTYRVPSLKKMTSKQAGHLIAQLLSKPVRPIPNVETTFQEEESSMDDYPSIDDVEVDSEQLANDVDQGLNA